MSDTKIKRSTYDILAESLDIIVSTYWIKGDEYKFAEPGESKFKLVNHINNSLNVLDEYLEGNKARIGGVCSVGALALADMTLYDEPLDGYTNIKSRDVFTQAAEAALSMAVLSKFTRGDTSRDPSVITDFNDHDETERYEVVEVFTDAVQSPLAKTKKIWGWQYFGGSWATKGDAMRARTQFNRTLKEFQKFINMLDENSYYDHWDLVEMYQAKHPQPALMINMLRCFEGFGQLEEPKLLLEVKA